MDDPAHVCTWCAEEYYDDEHAPWCCRECEEEELEDIEYRNNEEFGN